VSNDVIRERCQQPSIQALIRQKRLRWLGHVQRMNIDVRLPKQLLWGRLSKGTRRQGGHKKRWFDVCMQDLKECGMMCSWKDICLNRNEWATAIKAKVSLTKKEILRQQKKTNGILPAEKTFGGLPAAEPVVSNTFIKCSVCNRVFSREGDRKRHSCTSVRSKEEVLRQKRSNSGDNYQGTSITGGDDVGGGGGGGSSSSGRVNGRGGVGKGGLDRSILCQICGRFFSRPSDLKRHSCDSVRSKKISIWGR